MPKVVCHQVCHWQSAGSNVAYKLISAGGQPVRTGESLSYRSRSSANLCPRTIDKYHFAHYGGVNATESGGPRNTLALCSLSVPAAPWACIGPPLRGLRQFPRIAEKEQRRQVPHNRWDLERQGAISAHCRACPHIKAMQADAKRAVIGRFPEPTVRGTRIANEGHLSPGMANPGMMQL